MTCNIQNISICSLFEGSVSLSLSSHMISGDLSWFAFLSFHTAIRCDDHKTRSDFLFCQRTLKAGQHEKPGLCPSESYL